MIKIKKPTGQNALDYVAKRAREELKTWVPYATATALTRCAMLAKKNLANEMRSVFDRPTPYVLNSLYVAPASKDRLQARILVKNVVVRRAVAENILLPQVRGGARTAKNFERALRHAGLLQADEYAVPARGAPLDRFGNVPGATQRGLLNALLKRSKITKRAKYAGQVFAGAIKGTRGIWQRYGEDAGKKVKPWFIFTKNKPEYQMRFEFERIAKQTVEQNFPREVNAALFAIYTRH